MLANLITASRLVAALALLAFPVPSSEFWTLYAWCGFSDMIDGTIARKLGTESPRGARLDSLSDIVFVAVCLVKMIPQLDLVPWFVAWVVVIIVNKAANAYSGYRLHGRLCFPHTLANKAAGLVIFATVPVVLASGRIIAAVPALAIALFAALQEGDLVRSGYRAD